MTSNTVLFNFQRTFVYRAPNPLECQYKSTEISTFVFPLLRKFDTIELEKYRSDEDYES